MEYLIDIIKELEVEKENLLNEKEKNIQEIKHIDKKIDYYKYVIGQYNWWQKIKQGQIESYRNTLEYSSSGSSLLSLTSFFPSNRLDLYIESRITKLKMEKAEIEESKNKIVKCVVSFLKAKNILESRNEQIDLRLVEIDREIDLKNNTDVTEKVYKLERGDKK